jgi:hypothetical protein
LDQLLYLSIKKQQQQQQQKNSAQRVLGVIFISSDCGRLLICYFNGLSKISSDTHSCMSVLFLHLLIQTREPGDLQVLIIP